MVDEGDAMRLGRGYEWRRHELKSQVIKEIG